MRFDQPRHGIFRLIPVRYNDRQGAAHDLRLRVESVRDETGRELPQRTRREGRNVRIRIGDPQSTVVGAHTYVLRYRIPVGVDSYAEHDELYWNVTGNDWAVPIGAATAGVRLPSAAPAASVAFDAFTGPEGARGRDARLEYADGELRVETTRALGPWEGLTLVVGWPKGLVHPPGRLARCVDFLRWNWPLFLPIPVGLWVLRRWRGRGHDPEVRASVAVQYEPPEGLTPSEVGALIDERADMRDITAAVVHLAVRGYLRIEEEESKVLGLFDRREVTLVRLPPPAGGPPLKNHEVALIDGLFSTGDRVRLGDLREHFYLHLPRVRRGIYNELVAGGLFEASPETVRARYVGAGVGLLVVGGALAIFWVARQGLVSGMAFVPPLVGVALSALILILAAGAMPRRTRRGVESLLQVRGLQEFIERVESPRLAVTERGLDPRQHFERVLPYAMALGVASRWAKAFQDLYTTPPQWYAGPGTQAFTSLYFVHGLERMNGTLAANMASAPRRSSSSTFGGSGFGGGGFSGGGHGGGGGGAW